MSKKLKVLQSKARLYVAFATTAVLLFLAALNFPLILPFHHVGYRTAAEMAIDKEWNWGLAAVVAHNYGEVELRNLGTLETDGIYIPEELAAANSLKVAPGGLPFKLSKEQVAKLNSVNDLVTHVAKTRCLDRKAKYCPVKLMSSAATNSKPQVFEAANLSKNVFALIESKLFESITGQVN